MAGMNKVMVIGNLGRDPEMRYLPSGSPVTNFSVAVTRKFTTRDGEQREETDWFSVQCFDKLAEIANQYLQKGKQVYVEGRVRLHTWDDTQTGEKRSRLEIRATELTMLGQRGDQPDVGAPGGALGGGDSRSESAENPDFENMPF